MECLRSVLLKTSGQIFLYDSIVRESVERNIVITLPSDPCYILPLNHRSSTALYVASTSMLTAKQAKYNARQLFSVVYVETIPMHPSMAEKHIAG